MQVNALWGWVHGVLLLLAMAVGLERFVVTMSCSAAARKHVLPVFAIPPGFPVPAEAPAWDEPSP